MNKKVVVLGVAVLLIIIILAVVFWPEKRIKYSDDPKDWVEEKEEGVIEVNYAQVTKGAGEFNEINQQYKRGMIETVFAFSGIYKGEFFSNKYYTPEGKVLMEITKDIKPNDGILQGVIIERIDYDQPVAFIFIDEDWRKILGENINIVWGEKYQMQKKFEFNEVEEGIYMDQIEDDGNRFRQTYNDVHFGGIIAGNVNRADVQDGKTDGVTLMMLS